MVTQVLTACDAEEETKRAVEGKWRFAASLLSSRERLKLLFGTTFRIVVGMCDLALAAAMYLLFMVLQGRLPQHRLWWMPDTVLKITILTACVLVFRALADIATSRFVHRQIQSIYNDFLLRLTSGYSQCRWSNFVKRNRSELAHHAIHSSHEAADFYHRCVEMTAGVVIVIVLTTALVYQSLIGAIVFACVLGAYYVIHRIIVGKRVENAAVQREESLRNLQKIVMGIFSSGREIRTYGAYEHFGSAIEQHVGRLTASNRRVLFLPDLMRVIADQGLILLFLAAIALAEIMHGDTHRLLSLLAFYFVLSRRLLPLIGQLSLIAGQMQSSYENVRIVAAELTECELFSVTRLPACRPSLGLAVELAHVSYGFEEQKIILDDVNLSLRVGEIAVLYGPSGTGKTSLIDLIAGVVQPKSGTVNVVRSAISYVPQDVPLLDDTIRNNLLFGSTSKPEDELVHALQLAQLGDFVAQLPMGLDTQVGDNGAQVSGGERQRLGLARALLRGGDLLLLDEATSALDPENERAILENLRATGVTILLATHRTTSHDFADRVLRIENCHLIEEIHNNLPAGLQKMTAGAVA